MKWVIIILASVATVWIIHTLFPGISATAFMAGEHPISWTLLLFGGTAFVYHHCLKRGR